MPKVEDFSDKIAALSTQIAHLLKRSRGEGLFDALSEITSEAEKFRLLVSHASVVILAVDRDERLICVEGKGLQWLDLCPGQGLGAKVLENLPASSGLDLSLRRALNGECFSSEGDVGQRRFEFVFAPIGGGGPGFIRALDERAAASGAIGIGVHVGEMRRQEELGRLVMDASQLLSSSQDDRSTLSALASLAVPRLSDCCAVYGVADGGELETLALVHRDPAFGGLGDTQSVLRVIATARAEIQPDCESGEDGDAGVTRLEGKRSMMTVPLVARGKTLGAVTFASLESGRRFGEAELETAQQLSRYAAIAVDNARLYQEAQEAIRSRDEFLAVASHELRTPVTSLKVQTQLLRKMAEDPEFARASPASAAKILASSEEQIDRVTKLIRDLLDVSGINRGQLNLDLEKVNLEDLIWDVISRYRADLESAGCEISFSAEGSVVGLWDRVRIEQVASNLIGNAIKYGKGSPISIRLSADGDDARLSVKDGGVGIPKEHKPRIFKRFERAVSTKKIRGLGLGLYIVRQILEAHGGTISVESEPGIGSTFTATIPLTPRSPAGSSG